MTPLTFTITSLLALFDVLIEAEMLRLDPLRLSTSFLFTKEFSLAHIFQLFIKLFHNKGVIQNITFFTNLLN
jgi:hypothetical protein